MKRFVQKNNLELYGYTGDYKIAFRIQAEDVQNEAAVLQDCLQEII